MLLGEVLITLHKPNIIIVYVLRSLGLVPLTNELSSHQIGEHALSEVLFQQQLDGVVLNGATYVPSAQKLVLSLHAIGSPSKADYYLQQAAIDLDEKALTLGDRLRYDILCSW